MASLERSGGQANNWTPAKKDKLNTKSRNLNAVLRLAQLRIVLSADWKRRYAMSGRVGALSIIILAITTISLGIAATASRAAQFPSAEARIRSLAGNTAEPSHPIQTVAFEQVSDTEGRHPTSSEFMPSALLPQSLLAGACNPGSTVSDPVNDVVLAAIDVQALGASVTGENLVATFHLHDVPTEMTFNRPGSCNPEYQWGAYVDVDNNTATGQTPGNSARYIGAEYVLLASRPFSGCAVGSPIVGPIQNHVDTYVLRAAGGNSWNYTNIPASIEVDPSGDTLRLIGYIPGINSSSKVFFVTHDWNPVVGRQWDESACGPNSGATPTVVASPTASPTSTPTLTPTPVPTVQLPSISGRVRNGNGTPIQGVRIDAGGGRSTSTNSNGNYTLANLPLGQYVVTPTKTGYLFVPPSITTDLFANQSGVDFTAVPYSDISVERIEVAQAFLDHKVGTADEIPLIEGKITMIRVFVRVNGNTPVAGMTARLHIRNAAGQEYPPTDTVINNSVRATTNPDRLRLNDTINFIPPATWMAETVTFWADIINSGRTITTSSQYAATFRPARTLHVGLIPIEYQGRTISPGQFVGIESWASQVYPTASVVIHIMPSQRFVGSSPAADSTLNWLQELKSDWESKNQQALNSVFGLFPEGALLGGVGIPFYRSAMGEAWSDTQQRNQLFAHETTHLLGMPFHTDAGLRLCERPTPNLPSEWPNDTCGIQVWGLDVVNNRAMDPRAGIFPRPDYMSYCWATDWRMVLQYQSDGNAPWTSPYTYGQIYRMYLNPESQIADVSGVDTADVLWVSGMIYSNGTASLDPVVQTTMVNPENNPPAGTQYCVSGQNNAGATVVSRCFDLAFVDPHSGNPTSSRSFSLYLPHASETTHLQLASAGSVLATRQRSSHLPTITVLSPNGGEYWLSPTGTQTIHWSAADVDGNPLLYSVFYSGDGTNWVPIAIGIQETQVNVYLAELAGGSTAKVRVEVTDGFNTASDESDGNFTVAPKAPWAVILSPQPGALIPPGNAVLLLGEAYSLQDGDLADAAYRWSSSRDGDLGTGVSLLAVLSPGEHQVTLTAENSTGQATTASVRVYVGAKTYLPLVQRR